MSSSESTATFSEGEGRLLLDIARDSIRHGLAHGRPISLEWDTLPAPFLEPRASFVTLHLDLRLRGCIGSLEARRPLAADIAHNAWSAAFRDSRFPGLSNAEFERVDLEISILTPAEPLAFGSEAELLAQLVPGVDGLILKDGARRGTFLPAVWDVLPEPAEFLEQLKRKAGLPPGHWSDSVRVWRYRTEVIG